MQRTRIILADDHQLILDALKNLLQREFDVVGTFADGHSLVEGAPSLKPIVMLLDISMPTMNGISAGQRLKQLMPAVKLIYMTMNQDPALAAEAFRLGANGYLLKSSAGSELLDAIRCVARGGAYVTSLMTEDVVGSYVTYFKKLKSTNNRSEEHTSE